MDGLVMAMAMCWHKEVNLHIIYAELQQALMPKKNIRALEKSFQIDTSLEE